MSKILPFIHHPLKLTMDVSAFKNDDGEEPPVSFSIGGNWLTETKISVQLRHGDHMELDDIATCIMATINKTGVVPNFNDATYQEVASEINDCLSSVNKQSIKDTMLAIIPNNQVWPENDSIELVAIEHKTDNNLSAKLAIKVELYGLRCKTPLAKPYGAASDENYALKA